MVTVVVGKKNGKNTCSVVSLAKEADSPAKVEFPVPSKEKLKSGTPKWANYVKGVVQNFKGMYPYNRAQTMILKFLNLFFCNLLRNYNSLVDKC